MIENDMHQVAIFPEDIATSIKSIVIDEYFMMEDTDYTIILLMSRGSISEYSTFLLKESVAHKIRLYVSKEHAKSRSYLNIGPIALFKRVHNHVFEFSEPKDPLSTAAEMVINILELRILSKT